MGIDSFQKDNLLLTVDEGIAILVVNRPAALNALNSEVVDELDGAFRCLDRREDVRGIILTGQGAKAFVAGADIAEMAEMNVLQARAFAIKGQRLVKLLGEIPKPIVAAVNGFALGGGLELALACDFIYCSEKARLGFPEVGLGIMPGFGGTQKLAPLVGCNRAKELIFTGKIVTAMQALQWGMVNEVFPADLLLTKTTETVRQIIANGQMGVSYAKESIANSQSVSEKDGLSHESALFSALFSTMDQKEGMRAFMEKRKPVFLNC